MKLHFAPAARSLVLVAALVAFDYQPTFAQTIGGCEVFPPDNPWNEDVSQLPVHWNSTTWVAKISSSRTNLHPDFGSDPAYGIPFIVVDGTQPFVPITYTAYGDESDPGPMPIPPNAPVEQPAPPDGDGHVLVIDKGNCKLYELYQGIKNSNDNGWSASSGAIFDLTANTYRPDGWTSADAAGLPIFPGLARVDECQAGEIRHALRFTVPKTQRGWIHPARHMASTTTDTTYPPMGLRMRLKASYDISNFTGYAKVILTALKKYGMILADNGSAWFISGATDPRWPDADIEQLKSVPGSAFEAVYTGPTKHTTDAGVAEGAGEASGLSLVEAASGDEIVFHYSAPSEATLELLDILGRSVLSRNLAPAPDATGEARIATSGLPHGVYFARLRDERTTLTIRVIK